MNNDRRPPVAGPIPGLLDEAGHIPHDRVIQAYEQERLRLAREIHDGPAQILANAIFELEYFEKLLDRNPEAVKEHLAQLKKDIRDGLTDVRRFIFDLRPPALSEMSLFPALSHYVADYNRQFGITVEFRIEESHTRLPSSKELAVFRIVQEALQNARKHAAPSQITIESSCDWGLKMLTVSIEDDGRGFDPDKVSGRHSRNFGLTSMRERAELIDADLQIESSPGRGTRITLAVPLD